MKLAPEYGIRAVRVPHEPFAAAWRAAGDRPFQRFLAWALHARRASWMKRRLRSAKIASNDHIFGLVDSGRMTAELVSAFLRALPPGVSELYCHPATRRYEGEDALPQSYQPVAEYEALIDSAVRAALAETGLESQPFAAA